MGDIYALRARLAEEHDLPLTLVYRDSDAGFVFALKKTDLTDAGGELPRGFIDVTAQKGRVTFATIELVSVRQRCDLYVSPDISDRKREMRE